MGRQVQLVFELFCAVPGSDGCQGASSPIARLPNQRVWRHSREMTLPGMDTAAHERLEVSFHPQQSHFLLISSQRQTPRYQGETTCQLLDMRSGAIERLGSREHPRRCTCSFDILPYIWASRLISSPLIGTSHAEFSACGTYVVKRHDVVELFWRVSVRNFCLDPET